MARGKLTRTSTKNTWHSGSVHRTCASIQKHLPHRRNRVSTDVRTALRGMVCCAGASHAIDDTDRSNSILVDKPIGVLSLGGAM